MSELLYVLKQIKHGKSCDPLHMINEIFHPDVAGQDLVKAILNLMNRIKSDQIFPKCMTLCNISKIYKQKGARNDLNSYRGVFRVEILRNILDLLI